MQTNPGASTAPTMDPTDGDGETDYGVVRDPAVIESSLVKIFKDLFQADEIGPDDDFFALGGDSLLATSLMSGVEKEFTSVIPISVLLEASTPRELAKRIVEDLEFVPPTNLVPVRTEGPGTPIFCVHGMDGDALFCRRLPPILTVPRPIYGLRASGLHGNEVPDVNLPVIASRYLAEIRKVQPAGPYLVLGQCGTSLIAYEIVQQLLRAGEEISGLILIDPATSTYVPWLSTSGMQRVLLQTRAHQRGQALQTEAFQTRNLSGDERRRMVKQALSNAIGAYTPKPMDVEGLIICSSGRVKKLLNSVRGYPALISRLESQEIEGDHAELFMEYFRGRPAKVAVTGNYINQFLARVAPV